MSKKIVEILFWVALVFISVLAFRLMVRLGAAAVVAGAAVALYLLKEKLKRRYE